MYPSHIKEIDAPLNKYGQTALHIVANGADHDCLEYFLIRGASPNIKDAKGNTPLHYAVGKEPRKMETFIKYDADINVQNNEGVTPLHQACRISDPRGIDILLKYQCNVNLKDYMGNSPLYNFLIWPCLADSLLEKLLNAGCRVEDAAKDFQPLHELAAEQKNTGIAAQYAIILIKRGLVDVNALDVHSRTPLHIAAQHSDYKFVKILLENGANYNLLDENLQHPLNIAKIHDQTDIAIEIVKAICLDKYQGCFVSDDIIRFITEEGNFHAFYECFLEELSTLSENLIPRTTINFVDLYTADSKSMYRYTKNPDIVRYVDELDNIRFLFYAGSLQLKFNHILMRRNAVEAALGPLDWLTGGRLPYLCIKKITQFLPREDLVKLSEIEQTE